MDAQDREHRRAERRAERERRRAEWRTARARTRAERLDERKERVLHTRISEQLAEDIRRVAEDLKVPTSNLVRNVLEETFSVVETVSANVGDFIEEVLDETEEARSRFRQRARERYRRRRRHYCGGAAGEAPEGQTAESEGAAAETAGPAERQRPRPEFPEVVGWQPLIVNRPQDCADCGRLVARGERAFIGLPSQGVGSTLLCRVCADARG